MAATATITTSDLAPKVSVRYSLGGSAPFELASGGTKEVALTERELIACANDHPWLEVKYPDPEYFEAEVRDPHVKPEDDVLAAAHGSVANDPEEAAKVEAAKPSAVDHHTAINAGLDQNEEVFVGTDDNTAVTLAADDALDADEADDKPTKADSKKKETK